MKEMLIKLEPIIWFMFGQGILLGTILMTGWILVAGILIPAGFVSAEALSYERAHMLGSNLIGRLLLLAIIALPLWKGAHHVRSLLVDLGGGDRDTAVATILYLVALTGSVGAVLAVVRL